MVGRNKPIPIVDIFAGPGGLGEGFNAFEHPRGQRVFETCLDVEEDAAAHQTLELRCLYHNLRREWSRVPDVYYDYLAGHISRNTLFSDSLISDEVENAKKQACHASIGSREFPDQKLDRCINSALKSYDSDQFILIGGPPCQAYSVIGRARRSREDVRQFEKDHRHYLYREYLRILKVHAPAVFIMENVKGILSSRIEGKKVFYQILDDLRTPGKAVLNSPRRAGHRNIEYELFPLVSRCSSSLIEVEPRDFIIECENYGIPQTRHRVIILGIRSDLGVTPRKLLRPHDRTIHIDQVISDLPRVRSGLSKEQESTRNWVNALLDSRRQGMWAGAVEDTSVRRRILHSLKSISDETLDKGSLHLDASERDGRRMQYEKEWFLDGNLRVVCNHEARTHIREDIYRYLYVACYGAEHGVSPRLIHFPRVLLPKHKNVKGGVAGTLFPDRFRVQVQGQPATTVTSHIRKDGHYFIHYDPTQCRSLTVREAARIQTFPDNYFFEGNRTAQYQQVGNAVPPLLARQIAAVVYDILKRV